MICAMHHIEVQCSVHETFGLSLCQYVSVHVFIMTVTV